MKKSDFKIDFSKRDVISMVCFTVVMVVVLVLGNSFGFVSADESNYLLNVLDYQSSSSYNSTVYCPWFGGSRNENSSISYDYFVNDLDISSFNFGGSDSVKYYMVIGNSYTTKDWVYLFPSDAFCYITTPYTYSSAFRIVFKNSTYYRFSVSSFGDGTHLQYLFINDDDTFDTVSATNTMTIGDDLYYYIDIGDPVHMPILSNMNYYSFGSDVDFSSYTNTMISYLISGIGSVYDINYMPHVGLNGFDNLVGVAESGQDDSNNMYLEDCKFNFTFNDYVDSITDDPLTYSHNWGGGYISFSAMLNDYQYEHIDNFSLQFDFQCLVKGVGTLHQDDNDPIPIESENDFYGNFFYSFTVPLSDLESGNISWRFSDLTGNMTDSSSVINGTNISHLDRFIANMTEYIYIDWSYWKLYCNCHLVSNSAGTSSTARIDSYNFVTGASSVVADGLGTNLNPYVSEDGTVSGDGQHNESNNSSQTTSTGYGNVTQNNNQTVNINNNVSNDVQNEIANIIGSTDDSSGSSWINTLMTILSTNTFLAFMSETFGFIPSAFWTAISTFFITCLSFLTGFCLLRLLFDLI